MSQQDPSNVEVNGNIVRVDYTQKEGAPKHAKTFTSEWVLYSSYAVPIHASPRQHQDMQDCFMAGCTVAFGLIMSQLDDGDDVSEHDAMYLERLREEIVNYNESVKRRAG